MIPPPPTSTLFPYTTLFRSRSAPRSGLREGEGCGQNQRQRKQRDRNADHPVAAPRSEEHTSELQSLRHLVCRLLLEKKKLRRTLYFRMTLAEVDSVLQYLTG